MSLTVWLFGENIRIPEPGNEPGDLSIKLRVLYKVIDQNFSFMQIWIEPNELQVLCNVYLWYLLWLTLFYYEIDVKVVLKSGLKGRVLNILHTGMEFIRDTWKLKFFQSMYSSIYLRKQSNKLLCLTSNAHEYVGIVQDELPFFGSPQRIKYINLFTHLKGKRTEVL